ncbi:L-2-hydroxyglutarate oxidase [Gloeobacter morelensis]|uniref:L-2-hydroxyglutarate oxidase n=1 Tax=Gloeobacter morelensis MG652769 TaxID=2781736 RepID=A0ABY3PSU4_9CYAN|nr:L-2-hydroxyglutarate oxidase [Gloeobacter morelensis]UFP96562.1 L-2-hydroxyglutarate oxidase [Gloeobacter morelensis MG652769]
MSAFDFAIVGGGIVGLSVGMALTERYPGARLLVLEKESSWASHQTGHNSGVIHSGVYYKPGSLKARFATAGRRAVVEFCQKYGIEYDLCGKVIVATESPELPRLENLLTRGLANGIPVERIGAERLREIEPHVRGLAAIRVPTAGIVNYAQVAAVYARLVAERGGEVRLGTRVLNLAAAADGITLETDRGSFFTRYFINCAGLFCDRVAALCGLATEAKIVPFRGEYYELVPEKRHLCKHLVYPVPNPDFPFLGVHFTRMIDGTVHAGPNAVLALAREGYSWGAINLGDTAEVLAYGGFWKLAARHAGEGFKEIVRSLSKAAFVRSLQQLIPEVQPEDVVPAGSGVRAQALTREGKLVDDFLFAMGPHSLHVLNAPSPAATASIPIGKAVVERLPESVTSRLTLTR